GGGGRGLGGGAGGGGGGGGGGFSYPADAICVRYPGCVWSSEVTTGGFVSIDITSELWPSGLVRAPMRFVPRGALPDLPALVGRLERGEEPFRQQEALVRLVEALFARELLDADELRSGTDGRRAIACARAFLAAYWDASPTLGDLATAVGVNKFVLVRSFRRELGTTPHRYLTRLRIERARTMLARGVALREVAAASGFADQGHLTRHFKRIVGLTPGEYAQQMRSVFPLSVSVWRRCRSISFRPRGACLRHE